MPTKKDKFNLISPIKGGCQWWMIEDWEHGHGQYVTIHKSFPNAEQEAKRLYEILKEMATDAG